METTGPTRASLSNRSEPIDFEDDTLNQFPWHAAAVNEKQLQLSAQQARHAEGLLDDDPIHPYRSARHFPPSEAASGAESAGYAAAREHGLSQGFNLFRVPPPPVEEPPPKMGWYVNVASLKSGHAPATDELSPELKQKRKQHVKTIMRHDPSSELKEQRKAVRRAVAALDEVDETFPADALSIASSADALRSDLHAFKSHRSRDRKLRERLELTLPLHEAAVEEARAKAEVQSLLRSDLYDVTSALADKWAALQREGEAARRRGLERMAEVSQALHEQLVEVELRLTDHVLLGTAEEADRMLRAPGPDGALLRALRRRQDSLFERQRAQKAVLVSVARRALETDELHREEIASYGRRLIAADRTHDDLADAATDLQTLCAQVRETLGLKPAVATKFVKKPTPPPKPKPLAPPTAAPATASAPLATGGTEPLLIRSAAPELKWERFEATATLAVPALGLALARDEDLPSVNIYADKRAFVESNPDAKPQSTVALSQALVAARVDLSSQFASSVSAGDVILAVNSKPSSEFSSAANVLSFLREQMGGKPDAEGAWNPTEINLDILRPATEGFTKLTKEKGSKLNLTSFKK